MYWHRKTYRINIEKEDFQANLEKLIEFKEYNTIKNHRKKTSNYNDGVVRGFIDKNHFTFWRNNKTWSGYFYPIFTGNTYSKNGVNILELKIRFNPFAEILTIIYSIFLFLYLMYDVVIQENNEFHFLIKRGIIAIIMFFLLQSVSLISYYDLKNQTIKELEKYFNLTPIKFVKKNKK